MWAGFKTNFAAISGSPTGAKNRTVGVAITRSRRCMSGCMRLAKHALTLALGAPISVHTRQATRRVWQLHLGAPPTADSEELLVVLPAAPAMVGGARLAVPVALSMVGGYVDVICFIRYNTFVATMTGNLVITGQTFFEFMHGVAGLHELKHTSPEYVSS